MSRWGARAAWCCCPRPPSHASACPQRVGGSANARQVPPCVWGLAGCWRAWGVLPSDEGGCLRPFFLHCPCACSPGKARALRGRESEVLEPVCRTIPPSFCILLPRASQRPGKRLYPFQEEVQSCTAKDMQRKGNHWGH